MSEKDGLFDNPNPLDLETEQAISQTETLTEIKSDTSAILALLEQQGGKAIEKLAQIERAEKQANSYLAKQKDNTKKTTKKNVEPQQAKQTAQKPSKTEVPTLKVDLEPKIILNRKAIEPTKIEHKSKPKNTTKKSSSIKDSQKLPQGWVKDEKGRLRDAKGKYVAKDELKKFQNNTANLSSTEEDAEERRLLDAITGVTEAIESPENLDPLLDSVKEISAPLHSGMEMFEKVSGFWARLKPQKEQQEQVQNQAIPPSSPPQQQEQTKQFSFNKKKAKKDEKQQTAIINWLKQIWKKPTEGKTGILNSLGLMLTGLARFPLLLLQVLSTGLMGILRGAFGWIGKSGTGLLGLLGKGGKLAVAGASLFGGISKLSTGILRKLPLIGSILAIGHGISGLFDHSLDENGQSNRGKRVGSGIGTIAGGAIGSILGPFGTIAGAMIGDKIGEKLGVWVAGFNWSVVGEKISQAWNNALNWIKSSWETIGFGNFANKIKTAWNTALNWISESWQKLDLIGKGKDALTGLWQRVADKGDKIISKLTGHFNLAEQPNSTNTDSNQNELKQAKNQHLLADIRTLLADTLFFWQAKGKTETTQSNISNGDPMSFAKMRSLNLPVTQSTIKTEFLAGNIKGLNSTQTAQAMNALSTRESSNNQYAVNDFGYIGLYQFGAEALADLGYIDKNKYIQAITPYQRKNAKGQSYIDKSWFKGGHQAFLNDDRNWKLKGGRQAYLSSKKIQDESAVALMNKNLAYLTQQGVVLNSAEKITGAGFAAHLKGAGNAKNFLLKGTDSQDGLGTKISDYYRLGTQAITQTPISAYTTTPISPLTLPVNLSHIELPSLNVPNLDVKGISQKIERESKKTELVQKTTEVKTPQVQSSGVDPILSLLTQDVSDRRIAHIVTGGIAIRRGWN